MRRLAWAVLDSYDKPLFRTIRGTAREALEASGLTIKDLKMYGLKLTLIGIITVSSRKRSL